MAGTIKGSAPRSLQKSTMARVMMSTFATPRLPAVIAMLMPGWIVSAISGLESSFRTIDGISAGSMWLLSNACSARNISGIGMPSSIRETFPPFFIFISSLLTQSICVLICLFLRSSKCSLGRFPDSLQELVQRTQVLFHRRPARRESNH